MSGPYDTIACLVCGRTTHDVDYVNGLRKREEEARACADHRVLVVVDLQRKLATAHKLLRRANAALSVAGRGIREGIEHADLTTDIEMFLIDMLEGAGANDGT